MAGNMLAYKLELSGRVRGRRAGEESSAGCQATLLGARKQRNMQNSRFKKTRKTPYDGITREVIEKKRATGSGDVFFTHCRQFWESGPTSNDILTLGFRLPTPALQK